MNAPPKTPFVGRPILRREDQRLLTGRGQFIADLDLPHTLHAVFVRSPVAHARIRAVDLSRAAAAPGVVSVLGGPELAQLVPPVPDTQLSLPSKWTALVQRQGPPRRRGCRRDRGGEPPCRRGRGATGRARSRSATGGRRPGSGAAS